MQDTAAFIASLLTAVGIGGVIGAYFQARFQAVAKVDETQRQLKERRYLCILILMLAKLHPERGLAKVAAVRPDIRTEQDVDDELTTELYNGIIFASDTVLESLAQFLKNPNSASFVVAASAMRKDLWGKSTKITSERLLHVSVDPSMP